MKASQRDGRDASYFNAEASNKEMERDSRPRRILVLIVSTRSSEVDREVTGVYDATELSLSSVLPHADACLQCLSS